MSAPRIRLEHRPKDASRGLKAAVLLAALALVMAVLWLGRSSPVPLGEVEEAALTEGRLASYLSIALEVRNGRREAREAGQPPIQWAAHPRVASALSSVGWQMEEYLLVEGQVNHARLALRDAEQVEVDADDPHSRPVPPAHVELVRARLSEVERALAPLPD